MMAFSALVQSAIEKDCEHGVNAVNRVTKTSFMMIYLCLCLGSNIYPTNQQGSISTLVDLVQQPNIALLQDNDSIHVPTIDAQIDLPLQVASDHPIHSAIMSGSLSMTRQTLEKFSDVDLLSKDKTPLMLAAALGHVDIMEFLLDQGADVYAENEDGNTALHIACEAGHVYATYVLLTAGADLDFPNNGNQTPDDIAMPHLTDLLDTNGVIDETVVRQWDAQYKAHRFIIPRAVMKMRKKRYGRFHRLGRIPEGSPSI